MPKIDLSNIQEAGDLLPPGTYDARLTEVKEGSTPNGIEMWRLTWTVLNETHRGRLVFDRIFFSEAALPRVKLLYIAVGIDTSKEMELTSNNLLDKYAMVTVEVQEYKDNEGRKMEGNKVAWAGYSALEPGDVEEEKEDVDF